MPHCLHLLLFLSFICAPLCYSFPVSTADDLVNLFKNAAGGTLQTDIELLADLDFSGSSLILPLGAFSNGTCVAFSGRFQGNGHSIKGLKMNNTSNKVFNHTGLFCSLKNAAVENLVIDSTCNFAGNWSGALSISVSGALTLQNIINKAAVSGAGRAGGFIGYIENLKQAAVVSFKDCVNDGPVTRIGNWVGGFIGEIYDNTNMAIIIFNSTSNGNVTGKGGFVGGFVGRIWGNDNMNVSIINSTSNCNTTGRDNYVGGFVGLFWSNKNIAVTILNSINNGNVAGSWSVGGFVGWVCYGVKLTISNSINNGIVASSGGEVGGLVGRISTDMAVAISSSTNNAIVTASYGYVGGLIGHISPFSDSYPVLFGITDSANKGSVASKKGIACGIVCADLWSNINDKAEVKNSINKGSVTADTYGYGITNILTVGRNVVSMGEVTGSSGSFTFWNASTDVDLFYGLDAKCSNCGTEATLFRHNTSTGFYDVVGTGEHVHDLLNEEAANQQFGMMWTSELELVENVGLIVQVSGLMHASFLVESGTPLNQVGNLSYYFDHEEFCVADGDSQPMVAFSPAHLMQRNMNVVVGKCINVLVGAPINRSERMIAGESLEQLAWFFSFSFDDFIVVVKETEQVLSKSSMIERDTVLKLCHNVSVSGVLNNTWIVEHGTKLGSISGLSDFWNSSFILSDAANTNQVYTRETLVSSDIVAIIIKSTRVVIEITPTDEVNTTEVIKSITDIVGADTSIVGVDVVWNDDGQVVEIIIIVKDGNAATTIVDVINGIDTGSRCAAGVLCRKTSAYVEGETYSGAHKSFVSTTLILLSFILINHFM